MPLYCGANVTTYNLIIREEWLRPKTQSLFIKRSSFPLWKQKINLDIDEVYQTNSNYPTVHLQYLLNLCWIVLGGMNKHSHLKTCQFRETN